MRNSDEDHENDVTRLWWRTSENGNDKVTSDDDQAMPRSKVVREMERLNFIGGEGGVDELRQKLLSYRCGDLWVPIGGMKKEDMDIPPVITILLTGLNASGKSSLVNLMYSVLGRAGLIPFAQTSGTTMYVEEHNVLRSSMSGFCVYDTRGLDMNNMEKGLDEVSKWMWYGVRHHMAAHDQVTRNSRFVKRKVNCVMVVADLAQIHGSFTSADFKHVEALRSLFHFNPISNSNEKAMLILTHGDTLNAEDRINARLQICEYLGISETNGVYDIPCLTAHGIDSDPLTAFALTEAVYRCLLQSDRAHLPKRKFSDCLILFFTWIMLSVASFFAFLSRFFASFGQHNKKL